MSHRYPHIAAKRPGSHFVSALLAFLDDLGGFNGTPASAWFSFVHYLLLCKELSLPVALGTEFPLLESQLSLSSLFPSLINT
jgi:hypothetical protein